MAQFAHTAVAMAQSSFERLEPRRGMRISRTRSDPRPGPGLDALVLEVVMGWEWRQVERPGGPPVRLLWNPKWGTPRCDGDVRPLDDAPAGAARLSAIPWDAPRPSTDPAAAWEMEADIERRALQYPYTVALTAIVAHTKSSQQGWENGWSLMRATPAQRCHAALRAAGYGPRC